MRIAIVGNSGSGKSTLARSLADALALTVLDLDTVAWEPGRIAVARSEEAAAADLRSFCETNDGWVIEGCYAGLMRRALDHSPVLLLKDPGVEVCLSNCRSRPWEPHKYASKAEQDGKLEFLIAWVRDYYSRDDDLSLAAHQALFDGYRGPKLRLAQGGDGFVDDLAARFDACAIHAREWTHAAHLVVGLWHVERFGPEDALRRLRTGIRRLNESHGGVNSAADGYHETITAAYVQLLAEYLTSETSPALDVRAIRLLAGPLAAKDVLFTFYSKDLLMSATARASWVEPDRTPLTMGTGRR